MLRSEIKENRQKVIDQLKDPSSQKETGKLESLQDSNYRCCLGHACHALNIIRSQTECCVCYGEKEHDATAPEELVDLVGFYSCCGGFKSYSSHTFKKYKFSDLMALNDVTSISPQEIGEYLESVIEGGEDTPWKSLSEYPE